MSGDLRALVVDAGLRAGLDRMGVATAEPFPETRLAMMSQIESGRSGRLGFTFKDPDRATDISASFPWAHRLVVGIRSYVPDSGSAPSRPGHGRIARFAVDDPYGPLREGLEAVAEVLRGNGHRAEVLADDDRLVDRAAAVRAGLGWWGKSTVVITPGLGPWFVIGTVVTDAEMAVDGPMVRTCGTCSACLPACPTGALVAPGVLDTRRCLAAIAQSPGVIPREWRALLGDRLYGCDDCLDACPPGFRLASEADQERGSVSLDWILTAADRTLVDEFSHFYLPGRSARILRRNALVAMGNDGDPRFVEHVALHVGHPDWLLRAHAIWALGRLGGPALLPVLESQLVRERRPEVVTEIEAELAAV
ncbi:MAG TPA: 4Fe-4S double cluster binding domain-containing protein [Acidimicrobiia bacterium]|nr:4Fe-4S double cluster binding domain-containing protein [Acidimicrobiia bacterium]